MIRDVVRAVVAVAALAGAGAVSSGVSIAGTVPPQALAAPDGGAAATEDTGGATAVAGETSFIEFAIRQGGALGVLAVVLWFYRRDYKALTEFWKQQNELTTRLVEDNTKAQTDMAAALRENTTVVHGAKNAIQATMNQRAVQQP